MKPISPVVQGFEEHEIVFAKDQPQYLPLPALRISDSECTVLTRWRLTWRERLRVLWTGDLYLSQMTFNKPLQPQRPDVVPPRLTSTEAA